MNINNIDPYKLLGVQKNFTLLELRTKFKEIILIHHPDKGGNEETFKIYSTCYKRLYEEYKLKQDDKQHLELKSNSKNYIKEQSNTNYKNINLKKTEESQFQKDFNTTFEKYRISTANDRGYAESMTAPMDYREDIDIKNEIGKYNKKKFNNHFESKYNTDEKKIIEYKDPEPLISMKALGYTELGLSKIDDFSGENETLKKLNYTDYMKAHTTTNLIDPQIVKERRKFRNMDDIKAYRSKISYTMSEKDLQSEHEKAELLKKNEIKRQRYLMEQDRLHKNNYEKVNQAMLEYTI
jgi:curved DNA-binding protein CbpA